MLHVQSLMLTKLIARRKFHTPHSIRIFTEGYRGLELRARLSWRV
jgi:hypothetical protein